MAIIVLLLFLLISGRLERFLYNNPDSPYILSQSSPAPATPVADPPTEPSPLKLLDSEYEPSISQSPICEERFTTKYFDVFLKEQVGYCSQDSPSQLKCLYTPEGFPGANQRDGFCIGQNAHFNLDTHRFELDCVLAEEPKVPLSMLRPYWYETGPHTIMDGFVAFQEGTSSTNYPPVLPGRNFTVLLKREGAHNIFHTFHEMMSLMYSIDMLRLATDPMTGRPYVSEADMANTQIVVLDDHPDGPFWDLWRIWSGRLPKRLHELVEEEGGWLSQSLGHLILPLAGAANPIWHGTWDGLDCTNDLREVFVRRVLSFYGLAQDAPLEPVSGTQDDRLILTFVDRRQTRRLEGLDGLLDRVRTEHPGVKIEAVDFGSISLREQIDVARKTDILVGVHGAGLTHSLFMKEGRGAVVEIFPPDFQYSGLRAIARERNLRYYKTHNTTRRHDADWHFEDLSLDPETFSTLVRHAMYSLYNRPGWSRNMD